MSDEEKQPQGIPPEWAGQMPPPYGYGFPPYPPMMPHGHMQQNMSPEMAQHHAYMHAMAMQHAQAMQYQAAQYHQAMMAAQAGANVNAPQPGNDAQAGANAGDPQNPFATDPLYAQAQAMLDGAMGEEEAGMFKEILGSLGMSDKEFWKGAVVGAAAALLLSNENVRGKLMGLVGGAGDMLKSGGSSVKESAMNTASSVKENVSAGSEIFRDTYQAGREGFKDSVERHKQAPQQEAELPEADPESEQGSNI
ncbi:YtxH domain-containing protein [Vibrio sp. SCSIO 43137]|uniref:YtxH domain-containing protein n=1 Tax=Vibrio sp. SCSIO 43137 TaxID=3021011 RepID=UPI002307ADA1|nr:YtxH domain-containing protein [Vibrio sp. SCSIO 43137]WCE30845.1 YtxH domain-containing protein [Vibrio sp. SCSIO 43137]